jgi:hypothetical protein
MRLVWVVAIGLGCLAFPDAWLVVLCGGGLLNLFYNCF